MKFIVALSVLATAVLAQQIPPGYECAGPCLNDAAKKSGCVENDVKCVCAHLEKVRTDSAACLVDKCGKDKAGVIYPGLKSYCDTHH